jgi:hypothetical protein
LGYKNAQNQFVPTDIRAQDVFTVAGVSAEEHIADAAKHLTADQIGKISGAVQSTALGAANGVATLDASSKLTASQLPNSVLGGLVYQGTFDASTGKDASDANIPGAAAANKGFYWIASVAGTYNGLDFEVGDWLVSNGTGYDEVDNTTVDQTARDAAEAAQTEAELLDAAYCTSEEDMAGKNLRDGAFVLMQVDNAAA